MLGPGDDLGREGGAGSPGGESRGTTVVEGDATAVLLAESSARSEGLELPTF
jgi:hypothetical protein